MGFYHKFKEIMIECYWELQVVISFLWKNPGSNVQASFMLCYQHCIFSLIMMYYVNENVISWVFHNAYKFQQIHEEYFFNHL